MRAKILSILLISNIFINYSFAAQNFSYQQAQPQPYTNDGYNYQSQYAQNNMLKGSVAMVPAGTIVNAKLTSDLSSETAYLGQNVSMALGSDFYYDNKLIAPAGSIVIGSVIDVAKAKHGTLNGKLCVRFTQINTPYGTQIPISAVIKTDDNSGVLVGGTKMDTAKEYAKDAVVGTAAGALTGLVFGALAGGSIGRGAALGTAVGAGGGIVKSVVDKGHDVSIPANAGVDLILTQPISTTVSPYAYEN